MIHVENCTGHRYAGMSAAIGIAQVNQLSRHTLDGDANMDHAAAFKSNRVLQIYFALARGEVLRKGELAQRFQITGRSVQRDIESLRCVLAEEHLGQDVIYDSAERGYRLVSVSSDTLSRGELLAVSKILLESRSLPKDDMLPILDKLVERCASERDRRGLQELIANEKHLYIEPRHGRHILDTLWEIGQAVRNRQVTVIEYERLKEPQLVTRRIAPVGILFSEYYFYLTAFLEDKSTFENPDDISPTIYRIDRIRSLQVTGERFHVPYKDRFEEGEFRKRVQFMFGGKLEHVRFRYTGPSVEAVLDRLPTAKIVEKRGDGYIMEAEVFGKGIEIWLRSQGSHVELIP